ncbi:MAG: response regulator transcription factor [Rhodospirillales bacterium]|nr:response regulator transcription factor [Rhodospirillales bacterium]
MRVLIVDRKTLLRESLALFIRSEIPGLEILSAPTIVEAASVMDQFPLGLLILEAEQGAHSQLTGALRLVYPGWRFALLGQSCSPAVVSRYDGFLNAESDAITVIAEIRRLVDGRWVEPARPAAVRSAPPAAAPSGQQPPLRQLTPRQQDVLTLLAQGRSTKEIARALDLGVGTIKVHLDGIYRALGVHGRGAAVARAQEFAQGAPGIAAAAAEPAGLGYHGTPGANVIRLDRRGGQRAAAAPGAMRAAQGSSAVG